MALIEGNKLIISGREFVIPPLTLRSLKRLQPQLASLRVMSDMPTPEQIDAMSEVVLAAINRNYPEVTLEDLLDLIDLGNMSAVFQSVLSVSGFVKAAPGEATSP